MALHTGEIITLALLRCPPFTPPSHPAARAARAGGPAARRDGGAAGRGVGRARHGARGAPVPQGQPQQTARLDVHRRVPPDAAACVCRVRGRARVRTRGGGGAQKVWIRGRGCGEVARPARCCRTPGFRTRASARAAVAGNGLDVWGMCFHV
eukprot:362336-Chlamydomonas_euryale.AAC.3